MLAYVYTFLLARLLPVDELGEYFLMFTIINLLGLAAMAGLDLGVVRFVSLFMGEKKYSLVRRCIRTAVNLGVPVGVTFTVLLVIFAPVLSDRFFDGSALSVTGLRIFAVALPFMVIARLFNATTQGMHRMQYQVYSRDYGEQIIKIVVTLALLALGAGLMGVVWANVVAVVLAAFLSFLFVLKVLPKRSIDPGKNEEEDSRPIAADDEGMSPAKLILRYSFPLAFANIVVALWLQIDTLLLGYFGTSTDVGYYGVAMKLALFVSKSITAFGTVFTPIIADLWNRNEKQELKELYVTISRWIFTLSLPVFLVLALLSDSLLNLFGSAFVVGGTALIVLGAGQLFSAATGAAGIMVLMSGRSKLELFNVSLALAVNVVLCLLLIPAYGFTGAAIAHMAAIVLVNIVRIIEILIFMKMFAYDRSYLKPLTAGIAGFLAVFVIARFIVSDQGLAQLLILASLLFISYVLAMVALGINEQDKNLFRKFKAARASKA